MHKFIEAIGGKQILKHKFAEAIGGKQIFIHKFAEAIGGKHEHLTVQMVAAGRYTVSQLNIMDYKVGIS